MKLLVKENIIDWRQFLKKIDPVIEHDNISNPFVEIAIKDKLSVNGYDIFIFDISKNINDELDLLKSLRNYNPSLKSIVVTSAKNRKYRSLLLNQRVDHFLFRETELDVLDEVLKRIFIRLTRVS